MAALPSGFTAVRDVLDNKHSQGSHVNVVGIVIDFRMPIQTRGADWKCVLKICDKSSEDETQPLPINIFRPSAEEMPDASCGDIALCFSFKIQVYNSNTPSLLSNYGSDIYIYKSSRIPRPPQGAGTALTHPARKLTRQPTKMENEYISAFYHTFSKELIPTEAEFVARKTASCNVKQKFCLLKDVAQGMFIDTIAQVVREPYDSGDRTTLYISDFTENHAFRHYTVNLNSGLTKANKKQENPYGYRTNLANESDVQNEWTGPFGKRTLQVTCFDSHAGSIREQKIANGAWVKLLNVQIKYGRDGNYLEGYLRQDRNSDRMRIFALDIPDDPEEIIPEYKEAIRRKRDYERIKKKSLKDIANAADAGKKRKAAQSDQNNSRTRRQAKRAGKQRMNKSLEVEVPAHSVEEIGLNPMVKCESQGRGVSLVREMLESVYQETIVDGVPVKLELPFVNLRFRTNVRIIDFYPHTLEDFARPKKQESEYNVLSDNEANTDSEDASLDEEEDMMAQFTDAHQWEWRFYLRLEDAVVPPNEEKRSMWAAVDNPAAQCLINLDASNLRLDSKALVDLRSRLWYLWGDLEEHVIKREEKEDTAAWSAKQNQPPADTSDEDESGTPKDDLAGEKTLSGVAKNRPFPCCIRQYGVKVSEEDPCRANAGQGQRWQRMHGLFGTKMDF